MENLIGKVFKLIRNSKQLSLRQVSGGYISAGQLSRFERDESHLSIDAFLNSLNRLNVSLEEFHYTYNLYHQIDDVRFSEDLSEAYCQIEDIPALFKGNFKELHSLVEAAKGATFKVLCGVRENADGKVFQTVYNRLVLRSWETNYSKFEADRKSVV